MTEIRLEFDGLTLDAVDSSTGEVVGSWDAISGRPGVQDASSTSIVDTGPIPEGNWAISTSNVIHMEDLPIWRQILSETGIVTPVGGYTSWGNSFVRINPLDGTDSFSRDGFHIHGGAYAGSAGCIDLVGGEDEFFAFLGNYDGDISLNVDYSGNEAALSGTNHPLLNESTPRDSGLTFDETAEVLEGLYDGDPDITKWFIQSFGNMNHSAVKGTFEVGGGSITGSKVNIGFQPINFDLNDNFFVVQDGVKTSIEPTSFLNISAGDIDNSGFINPNLFDAPLYTFNDSQSTGGSSVKFDFSTKPSKFVSPNNLSGGFSLDDNFILSSNLLGGAKNHVSPLVFDLDGDGIELTHAYDQEVYFDIDNDGHAERVGWVVSDDGLLAMDHNGNGNIDDITELYGDDIMPAFDKLALHDSNSDGVINASDSDFADLLIWSDLNQDGLSQAGELMTLAEAGIVSISLDEQPQDRWLEENYISSNATFTWAGGQTGEVADVHFLNDNADSWFKGAEGEVFGSDIEIDFEALLLPQSRGYGEVSAFHIAMSKDNDLKDLMIDLATMAPWEINTAYEKTETFLLNWAGVADNDPEARATGDGSNIDARHIDFLEKITGVTWLQRGLTPAVNRH